MGRSMGVKNALFLLPILLCAWFLSGTNLQLSRRLQVWIFVKSIKNDRTVIWME